MKLNFKNLYKYNYPKLNLKLLDNNGLYYKLVLGNGIISLPPLNSSYFLFKIENILKYIYENLHIKDTEKNITIFFYTTAIISIEKFKNKKISYFSIPVFIGNIDFTHNDNIDINSISWIEDQLIFNANSKIDDLNIYFNKTYKHLSEGKIKVSIKVNKTIWSKLILNNEGKHLLIEDELKTIDVNSVDIKNKSNNVCLRIPEGLVFHINNEILNPYTELWKHVIYIKNITEEVSKSTEVKTEDKHSTDVIHSS